MYYGDRGNKFKKLIFSLFQKAQLNDQFIKICLNETNLKKFNNAFSSASIDQKNNYEFYEQLGDSTVNKFIVSYMYSRFPQLKSSNGVNVVARLKIKYGSKGQLYQIADKLGFWEFISAHSEERIKRKKSLLEDVFEAFFGCLEDVVNETIFNLKGDYYFGVGFDVSCTLLRYIFDDIEIKIDYESLVDAKTRLKELFDEHKSMLIQLKYDDIRCPETNFFISKVYNKSKFLGSGMSTKKKEAQEKAAENALVTLERLGYKKEIPKQYIFLD